MDERNQELIKRFDDIVKQLNQLRKDFVGEEKAEETEETNEPTSRKRLLL